MSSVVVRTARKRKQSNPKRNAGGKRVRAVPFYAPIRSSICSTGSSSYKCIQRATGSLSYNQSTGWGSSGFGNSLVIAMNQLQAYYSIGGTAYNAYGAAFPNVPHLNSVFDMVRVNRIWFDMYWTNNDIQTVSTSGTVAFPMCYCVVDQNDGSALNSSADALQYSSCQVFQLGNTPNIPNKPACRLVNRDPRHRISTDTTSIGSNNNSLMSPKGQWMATDLTSQETGYFKIWLDPIFTSGGVIGQMTGILNVEMEFKNVR